MTDQVSHPYRTAGQIVIVSDESQNDCKCGTGRDIEGSKCDVLWRYTQAHSCLGNKRLSVCTDAPSGAITGNYSSKVQLTLNPLTWKIWWAPNNASRWQMGFNSAFEGLNSDDNCNQSVSFASYWWWGITLWVEAFAVTAQHIPVLSDTWPAGSGAVSISTPAEQLRDLQLRTHSCLNKRHSATLTVTSQPPLHSAHHDTNWTAAHQTKLQADTL